MSIKRIQQKEVLYTKGFTDLAIDMESMADQNRAVFKGIAITTGYNSKHYRFSLPSLQSLAKQAKQMNGQNGVPIHVMHSTFWDWSDLPVGRTLSAMMRKKTDLEVTSYLKLGVPTPDTNSIADRMGDGTIDSLSIGWALTDKSYFKCDTCDEKMDVGYFMPRCAAGHYPGKMKDDGKIATATVHGEIRFRELSIVGTGADSRAKILQEPEYQDALREEFNALTLQPHDFPLIAELAGWDEGMFAESLSYFDIKGVKSMLIDKTKEELEALSKEQLLELFETEGGTPNTPEPTNTPEGTPNDITEAWKKRAETAERQLQELKDGTAEMITKDDLAAGVSHHREQRDNLQTEVNQLKEELKDNKFHATVGIQALTLARDRAVRAYKTYKGGENRVQDPISQAKISELEELSDVSELAKKADEYWALADEPKRTADYEESRMPSKRRSLLEGVEDNVNLLG